MSEPALASNAASRAGWRTGRRGRGTSWRIIIDQEHGAVGLERLHAMIAATAGTRCAPLVRVPRRDEAWVKPALDLGAEGIVVPLVRTAEDAAECVSLLRYPPGGRRGWGLSWRMLAGVSAFSTAFRSAAARPSACC
jgi:2-keto-3-deoxy-L-rhamnonate aldolase RhmA